MADGRACGTVVAASREHRLDRNVRRKAHGAAARSGADGARRRVDAGCDFCALYLRSMVIGFEQRRRLKGVTFDPWPRGSARNGRQGDRRKDRDYSKDADDLEQREAVLAPGAAGEISASSVHTPKHIQGLAAKLWPKRVKRIKGLAHGCKTECPEMKEPRSAPGLLKPAGAETPGSRRKHKHGRYSSAS